jgi:hypothetical protein
MIEVWDKMILLADEIVKRFQATGEIVDDQAAKQFPWANHVYTSNRYRRAHIDIVDARKDNKLWMMHVCVFPHFNDPSPIFGFDAVCGRNKITGVFHDFSPAGELNHPMINWFDEKVESIEWKKERTLPDWAKAIFTPSMVAASNVNTEEELDKTITVCLENLDYYLKNVGNTQESGSDFHMAQNRYCYYQKQNPHTPRVMTSLGLDERMVHDFIHQVLFPEVT